MKKNIFQLPDRIYDAAVWVGLMGLPSLSLLYSTLAGIWGLPYAEEIPATISAVDACLGALLGVSAAQYGKQQRRLDAGGGGEK